MSERLSRCDVLLAVIRAIPNPDQISKIDVCGEPDAIRFEWKGVMFRVSGDLSVEVIENGFRGCRPICTLLEALLKAGYERGRL